MDAAFTERVTKVRRRAEKQAGSVLRRAGNLAGFDMVRRNFYSPLPRLEDLSQDTFQRRSTCPGIEWNEQRHESFLRDLAPFLTEFAPPEGFSWDNVMYGPVESEVLYAIVRRSKPSRIVELGSGWTSLIIAAACRANASEGKPPRYACFDPFPRDFVRAGVAGMGSFHAIGATEVPQEEFDALGDGDILFIDTTHTVKVGSDVNRLILEVLPTLRPGVLIHIHDIFLPYEYPRGFYESQCYWQEQYLLQALLAENPNFEIVLPVGAISRDRPDLISELLPSHQPPFGPGAFWIRRTGAAVHT